MRAGGVYTFVRSLREAAEVAIRLAGGKDVDLFSASIAGQRLRAGLVDEVHVHLAPVLLGAGTRRLDDNDGHIRLICAPQLTSAKRPLAAQNGGTVRGYTGLFASSAA